MVVNLLDPTDPSHTDSIRLTALGIITAALSVSLTSIASYYRTLLPIITDRACRYLFQLVASTEEGAGSSQSILVLERSLRVIGMLFGEESLRGRMKLQQELFLSFTLDRLEPPQNAPGNGVPKVQLSVGGKGHSNSPSLSSQAGARVPTPDPSAPRASMGDESHATTTADDAADAGDESDSTPPLPPRLGVVPARGETRELLMETLVHLATRQSSFVPDLWVNYDCDLNCEDVFDKLINFLTLVGGSSCVDGSRPSLTVHRTISCNAGCWCFAVRCRKHAPVLIAADVSRSFAFIR